jgi:hypothetical protein
MGVLVAAAPALAAAQPTSLIREAIDEARAQSALHWGPFWLTPRFDLALGYDSNGLFLPEGTPDASLRGGAGLRVALPAGRRFLLDADQGVQATGYREIQSLRDVAGSASARLLFGGRSFRVSGSAGRRSGLVRPTELEILVDQAEREISGGVVLRLGKRQELTVGYRELRIDVKDLGIPDIAAAAGLLDRTETDYRVRLTRRLTHHTAAVVDAGVQHSDFVAEVNRSDTRAFDIVAGAQLSPSGRVRGQAILGYKRIVTDEGGLVAFQGIIGLTRLRFRLTERLDLTGLFLRNANPSFLGANLFYTESRYGGILGIALSRSVSARVGVVAGRIDHDQLIEFVDRGGARVSEALKDRLLQCSGRIDYALAAPLQLSVDLSYLARTSSAPALNRDRLVLSAGVSSRW